MKRKITYKNKVKGAELVQIPLFLIKKSEEESWIRSLAFYARLKLKAKHSGGFFLIDSNLTVDMDLSQSNCYKHITILIERGLVEKVSFKKKTMYKLVGRKNIFKNHNLREEGFFNTVLVFEDNTLTEIIYNLRLKIIEQCKQQQEYAQKKVVDNNDYSKPNEFFTNDSQGWLSYDLAKNVTFDDYYLADKIGISQRTMNNMRRYYESRNLMQIKRVYKEVLPDIENKRQSYNHLKPYLKKEISHITYFSDKIVYLIGSSFIMLDYFNNIVLFV